MPAPFTVSVHLPLFFTQPCGLVMDLCSRSMNLRSPMANLRGWVSNLRSPMMNLRMGVLKDHLRRMG